MSADYSKPVVIQKRAPTINEHGLGQRVAVIDKGNFWGNYIKVKNWAGEIYWKSADQYWNIF